MEIDTVLALVEQAMREAFERAASVNGQAYCIPGGEDIEEMASDFLARRAAGLAAHADTGMHMFLACIECPEAELPKDSVAWRRIMDCVGSGEPSRAGYDIHGGYSFADTRISRDAMREAQRLRRHHFGGDELIRRVRDDLIYGFAHEGHSQCRDAVDLLDQATDRALWSKSYAVLMESVFASGNTVEMRELFAPFGDYGKWDSDEFPHYRHTDSVNAIDTSLLHVRTRMTVPCTA